jgi:hypothetical protein
MKVGPAGVELYHAGGQADRHDEDDINILEDNAPNCLFWFIGTPAVDCQTVCLLFRLCCMLVSDS